jgi:hypothetical protein
MVSGADHRGVAVGELTSAAKRWVPAAANALNKFISFPERRVARSLFAPPLTAYFRRATPQQ